MQLPVAGSVFFALAAAMLALPAATASALTINGAAAGWYQSDGLANPLWVGNYIAGLNGLEHRDYFIFDLGGLSQPVLSASLTLRNPAQQGYQSPDATETFELFDVSTDLDQLGGSTGGVAAFADLGTGVSYGTKVVSATDNGASVVIALTAGAIAGLNASLGGLFALGGAVTTLDGALNEYVFGNTAWMSDELMAEGYGGDIKLSYCTAGGCGEIVFSSPEPGTAVLVLTGLTGLAARRRGCA